MYETIIVKRTAGKPSSPSPAPSWSTDSRSTCTPTRCYCKHGRSAGSSMIRRLCFARARTPPRPFTSTPRTPTSAPAALGFGMSMKSTKVINGCEIKVSPSGSGSMKRINLESAFCNGCSYLHNSEYRVAGDDRVAELFACLPCRELQDVCKAHYAGCLFYIQVAGHHTRFTSSARSS